MSRLSEDNNVLLPRFFLHVDWPTFREFRISFMRGREGRGLLFVPVELIFWCLFVCIKIDGQCTCAKCTTLLTVFWNGKLSSTKFLCRLGDDEIWKLSKRTHLWSGRCRDHVSLGEDWMGPVIVPLGCLLYSCIHSCVSRLKRIYATFRGDEWINKRIINRNLISYIKIVYVCYLNSVKSA